MNSAPDALASWLVALDGLPLECDGLTRVAAHLLTDAGVAHRMHAGVLDVGGVGRIPVHWWITFPAGAVLDLRARLWLGEAPGVPHGLFHPDAVHRYVGEPQFGGLPRLVLDIMAGRSLAELPPVPSAVRAAGAGGPGPAPAASEF